MNRSAILFIILLLGFIFCSFLGGCGLKEGMTVDSADNTSTNGSGDVDMSMENVSEKVFYGPNGGFAKIKKNDNGSYLIEIKDSQGNASYYTYSNADTANNSQSSTSQTSSTMAIEGITFTGPYDGRATVVSDTNGNYTIVITYPTGEKIIYYPDNAAPDTSVANTSNTTYYPPSATPSNYMYGSISGPNSNSIQYASGPRGNSVVHTDYNPYSSSLSAGIPSSQIPSGDEDLYILKSSIVPPVCPACPSVCTNKDKHEPPPPCPACARCPEPSFECKKVPNYSQGSQNQYLPTAVLNDFSSFGM